MLGIGNLRLSSGFVGNKKLKSVWYGNSKVWQNSIPVTITGSGTIPFGEGSLLACYVDIGGTRYTTAQTLQVPIGTVLSFGANGFNGGSMGTMLGRIYLNGTQVASSYETATYELSVSNQRSIEINLTANSKLIFPYGEIDITTT